jgi:hypothetical protein
MPVLHGGVAQWEGFVSRPAGFAKATVGITSTRMRVVLALSAVKVRAVAVIAAVLGAEARL